MIELIKERITALPLLSTVANRLLGVLWKEEHNLQEIVAIIETDAALTTKVLRVANSAAYSRGKQIETVNRAIVMLGETLIMGIALGSCTNTLFEGALEGYHCDAGELWDHSLKTAMIARRLSNFSVTEINSDIAFTAGLLHDVGKSIQSEFLEIKSKGQNAENQLPNNISYDSMERDTLGIDHSEIGYFIAKHWNLPEILCLSIKYHHNPGKADIEFRPLLYTVHLSDLFTMMTGSCTGVDALSYELDLNYKEYINFDKNDLATLILDVASEFEAAKNSML